MSPIQHQRQECIIYSRVVGWYSPIQNWNKGKRSEFSDRLAYEACNCSAEN